MNFFKIQTETLTNLANAIRKLDNSTNTLKPVEMQNNLSSVDTEINIQTKLIRQITLNLENYINGETQEIITFTIDGNTYEALEGMTWAQWYISQYNTNNLIYCTYTTGVGIGDYVYDYATKSLVLSINGVMQKDNDLIVANSVFEWITKPIIDIIPTVSGSLTYNGNAQSPTWNNYDTTKMTISGTTSATNAGTYTATFIPISGYTWSDGTTTAKNITWTINKATGSLSINKTSMSLNTSTPTGTITVTRAGNGTISATSSNISVASVSVSGTTVTVTGKATGNATITIKVATGTNHTAPSNKTCSVSCEFLPTVGTPLNDISWADIKRISDAGLASSYFNVGDRKAVTLNGTVGNLSLSGTYYCYIIGINHNSAKEGSNRIHFQIGKTTSGTDIAFCDSNYNSTGSSQGFRMNLSNTNSGGWNGSYGRKTLLGNSGTPTAPPARSFMAALPADLRAVMKSVTKYTDNRGNDSTTSGAVTATTDYLFFLSEFEIQGVRSYANQYEQNYQAQYDYYKAGNSKVKYRHDATGTAVYHWCRSAHYYSSINFCIVNTDGTANRYDADFSIGLAPGFCV